MHQHISTQSAVSLDTLVGLTLIWGVPRPGLWAATVAIYCPSRMVEHPKSKSTNQGIQGDGGLCIISGDHTYFDVHVTKMRDLCDRGEAWRTWQNMRIVDWSKEGEREASFEGTGRGRFNGISCFILTWKFG